MFSSVLWVLLQCGNDCVETLLTLDETVVRLHCIAVTKRTSLVNLFFSGYGNNFFDSFYKAF